MKACIAVADYYVAGQTFVNRHIEHLFGGNTCVVAGRLNGKRPTDARFFQRREPLGLPDMLVAPFAMLGNQARHGTPRVPFGSRKRALLDWLEVQKPDVILSEFGTQGVVLAPIAAQTGIPMFCYYRGSDASSRLRHKHVRRAYRLMMPKLAGIVGVSQFLIDNLGRAGVSHPHPSVIPSGVDVRLFQPADKRPGRCLAVGRLVAKKAPLTTIRSFAEVSADHPHMHLTMIGDGELFAECQALVQALGVGDRVSLPGSLPHDAVRQHLAEAEIFVQHSVTPSSQNTEGLPTAIQEAMATGCLIVSTRHAGIPEAVRDGVNGLLVDEYDADGFTAALRRLVELAPAERQRMAQAARRDAETHFDNAILLGKLEDLLRASVKGVGGR